MAQCICHFVPLASSNREIIWAQETKTYTYSHRATEHEEKHLGYCKKIKKRLINWRMREEAGYKKRGKSG